MRLSLPSRERVLSLKGICLRSLLLCFFTSALLHAAPAPESATLSLKEALHYAYDHSPVLDTARRNLEIGDLGVGVARSKFLPSLDASATHGLQYAEPKLTTDPYVSALSLGLTENLYDNGISWTNFDISKITRDVNRLQALQVRDQLALDVSTQFYQYSLALKLADVQKQQVDILQKKLRSVRGQFREGMQTKKDYLRFKNQVQRADLDLLGARLNIDRAVLTLNQLLGAPTGSGIGYAPIEVATESPSVPVEAPPIDHSFEKRIAATQGHIPVLQTRLAIRQYWPQLNLTSGVTYGNLGYLNSGLPFNDTHTFNAGVQLAIAVNLWDWGQRGDNVEIARRQELIADNNTRQASLTVEASVRTLMLTLTQQKASFALSQELLGGEETTYEVILRDYEEGRVQYLDLIGSLQNLLDAKTRLYTAYYDLAQSLAQYHYYDGNLYETLASP